LRNLAFIYFLFISTQLLFGQSNNDRRLVTKKIKTKNIDYVDIDKDLKSKSDSIPFDRKRLTEEQIKIFASNWNVGKWKGVYKFRPSYYITIYYKNGSQRQFQTNNTNLIKEDSDLAYEIGDLKYVDSLWNGANIHPINSIKTIFDNYIKYNESTDSKSNRDLMTSSLEKLKMISEPADFDLLLNVWMYYSPTDFPSLHLIPELLKKNKPESIEAVKNRIQNRKEWENKNTAPYSDLYKLLQQLEE
jgi:hypothetical protein